MPKPSRAEIRTEQWRLNHFFDTRDLGFPRIAVDGDPGAETRRARKCARFYLGLRPGVAIDEQHDHYSVELTRTLWKPRRVVKGYGARAHIARLRLAGKRQRARKRALRGAAGNSAVMRVAQSYVGKTENGNRAPWLDKLARKYVGAWMVGQPWCGLFCIFVWAIATGKKLPAGTVYTPNLVAWARRGEHFTAVAPSAARAGDLVVFNFPGGDGRADHVGLARGPARNGSIPTVEGNTSPGSGGSQANGGGVYNRTRPVGLIAVVARPK